MSSSPLEQDSTETRGASVFKVKVVAVKCAAVFMFAAILGYGLRRWVETASFVAGCVFGILVTAFIWALTKRNADPEKSKGAQRTMWFAATLIAVALVYQLAVHAIGRAETGGALSGPESVVGWQGYARDLTKDVPSWLFATGAGLFALLYFGRETKEYIRESLEEALTTPRIFNQFDYEARARILRQAIVKDVPDFSQEAILALVESARKERTVGLKKVRNFRMNFKAMPAAPCKLISRPDQYLSCDFSETYEVSLQDKLRPLSQWFTFDAEKLAQHFRSPECIYRDLLCFLPEDRRTYSNLANPSAGDLARPELLAEIRKIVQSNIRIRAIGQTAEFPILEPKQINPRDDGFEFVYGDLSEIAERLKLPCRLEVTTNVRFPIWKEARGYPLMFMSYSEAPLIQYSFAESANVIENSVLSFLSGLNSSSAYTVSRDGDEKNPTHVTIRVHDNHWVLPLSGVYITWTPRSAPTAPMVSPALAG